MQTTNMSEFRKYLKKFLNIVTDDHETVIINRGEKKAAVIISLDEYNSFIETNYLLSSKKNAERLESALNKANNGKTFTKDLIEE